MKKEEKVKKILRWYGENTSEGWIYWNDGPNEPVDYENECVRAIVKALTKEKRKEKEVGTFFAGRVVKAKSINDMLYISAEDASDVLSTSEWSCNQKLREALDNASGLLGKYVVGAISEEELQYEWKKIYRKYNIDEKKK